jgi:CheY-like chemotaxis protein
MSVVAVTADFTAENQQKCLQSGFDQIMSKPLNRKNTEKVLREYLTPLKLPP